MVLLSSLLEGIELNSISRIEGLAIKGIKYDSRQVTKDDLFVAIRGFKTDGHKYIEKAIANGACAVVIEDAAYRSDRYPWLLVNSSREVLADLSAAFNDHPSREFLLIGVTGTNGKTTTTNLIAKVLEDQGHKVGLIGTIHNRIGNKIIPVERTTPESLDLQQLFKEMVENKVDSVIMEVSSHALDLHRVRGSDFDVAVFTNLTQDHLDYHHTMEKYYQAKAALFTRLLGSKSPKAREKLAVINGDDPWGQKLLKDTKVKTVTYGINSTVDFKAEDIQIASTGVSYSVNDSLVQLQLTGKFNVYNSLAALAVVANLGIPLQAAAQSLKQMAVSGRFQLVEGTDDFAVIVDYAHTPDSLINILATAQEFVQGRIITVFGCGGDRDRTKRPIMGKAAAQYSDFCIVTSDNPRSEEPERIIGDILPGLQEISTQEKYKVVIDRKKAIEEALNMADRGDIVIIAGKGHETYQEIKGQKYPFDDKEVAEEILKVLSKKV
ncbi:MAG: UDP-N-acetylmuramoyl-L-alanyl-D-glutamate--2,6-diaminopimelate ligase [Bacillota bacterium]